MQVLVRMLFLVGVFFIALAGILTLAQKIPWLGRLPGDIRIERENFVFYFPITTCILISVLLSLVFWLVGKK